MTQLRIQSLFISFLFVNWERLAIWKIFLHLLLLMAAFIWEECVACRFGNFYDCHIHLKFELWWWKKVVWEWTFQVNSEHYKQLVKVFTLRNPDHRQKKKVKFNSCEIANYITLIYWTASSFNNRWTILIKRCPQGTHFTFLGSLGFISKRHVTSQWHHLLGLASVPVGVAS